MISHCLVWSCSQQLGWQIILWISSLDAGPFNRRRELLLRNVQLKLIVNVFVYCRAKRQQELQHLKKQKEDEALKLQMQLQRQRAMRLFHERQLALLEIIHASMIYIKIYQKIKVSGSP